MISIVALMVFCIAWIPFEISAFAVPKKAALHHFQQQTRESQLWASGDPVRAATGIRPSLHPVTINAIAEALRQRACGNKPFREMAPLEIAQVAGAIAIEAIAQRQKTSAQDGMQLTPEEEQTIAGRVVGVVVRFEELEGVLREKCQSVEWIAKYQEWSSFGLLAKEDDSKAVDEQISMDPLFCMNRAECLLALFLSRVEAPSLLKLKQEVPGGSAVDFIDADRLEVLD